MPSFAFHSPAAAPWLPRPQALPLSQLGWHRTSTNMKAFSYQILHFCASPGKSSREAAQAAVLYFAHSLAISALFEATPVCKSLAPCFYKSFFFFFFPAKTISTSHQEGVKAFQEILLSKERLMSGTQAVPHATSSEMLF